MKVGDLVNLKGFPTVYGIVMEVRPNAWVGSQVAVSWIKDPYRGSRKYYALAELEVINEKQV